MCFSCGIDKTVYDNVDIRNQTERGKPASFLPGQYRKKMTMGQIGKKVHSNLCAILVCDKICRNVKKVTVFLILLIPTILCMPPNMQSAESPDELHRDKEKV